jgi:5-methylcytosine-specific restriction enzyme subunit McrC
VQRIELTERDPAGAQATLPLDVAAACQSPEMDRILTVRPSRSHSSYRLIAKHYVGVLRIGQTELWIRPKFPVRRLMYLLGFARENVLRDKDVELNEATGVVSLMALLFVDLVQRALCLGVLHGYHQHDLSEMALRGRLRAGAQLQRRYGLALPLEVSYNEPSPDVPENQILLAAALKLLRFSDTPGAGTRAAPVLHRCVGQLAGVSQLPEGQPLPEYTISQYNAHYQPALRLAELILGDRSAEIISPEGTNIRVTGVLLNMWRVFQEYVAGALQQELQQHGGVISPLERRHLDKSKKFLRYPDMTWSRDGVCRAVVDAKYKRRSNTNVRDDLHQIIAYCVIFRARDGHLVYVDEEDPPETYEITNSRIRVHLHSLKLDKELSGLEADVVRLAERIRQLDP